ncbi:ABC transporter, permease protein [Peptoniphilus sp. ING2-D1G]|nr:ABC transporter, permease protein [Peptoniphilus sp. ING2-D1G]
MKNKKLIKNITKILSVIALLILSAVYIIPFVFTIGTSLMTFPETIAYPPNLLPKEPQFENYVVAFENINLLHYLKNSIIITTVAIIGQIFVCIPAAYAFAKKKFKFKNFLFPFILFDLIIPAAVVFLPIFLTVVKFEWLNTYKALTIPFFYSAFSIFFLTQSFRTIPDELLDAAKIDKASEFQLIKDILIPSSRAVIITVGLFTFISRWNDYFWVTVLTTDETVRTLPMAVQNLLSVGDGMIHWNIVMAGNVFLMVPMLIIYFFASKSIKKAFTYGGIK